MIAQLELTHIRPIRSGLHHLPKEEGPEGHRSNGQSQVSLSTQFQIAQDERDTFLVHAIDETIQSTSGLYSPTIFYLHLPSIVHWHCSASSSATAITVPGRIRGTTFPNADRSRSANGGPTSNTTQHDSYQPHALCLIVATPATAP